MMKKTTQNKPHRILFQMKSNLGKHFQIVIGRNYSEITAIIIVDRIAQLIADDFGGDIIETEPYGNCLLLCELKHFHQPELPPFGLDLELYGGKR
eukprot:UN08052